MSLVISDIRERWPEIKDRVAALCEGNPERAEDIYAACTYGKATLLMCEDGYLIVRLEDCKYTGKTRLWIWQACASMVGAIEKYKDEMDGIAREQGAVCLRWASKRNGFDRMDGWTKCYTVYERRLESAQEAV